MYVGAGTLLSPRQVRQAIDAGAEFGVTPGFNPTVIQAALADNFPLIPGAMTPGEMERAMELGCNVVKWFPAETAGGAAFLKALSGPYAHTPLRVIPLGGVCQQNMKSYLAVPLVAAVGGSWMASRELVNAANWAEVTRLSREALALIDHREA